MKQRRLDCAAAAHLCDFWRGLCLVNVTQHMGPVLKVNTNLWTQGCTLLLKELHKLPKKLMMTAVTAEGCCCVLAGMLTCP